jgi:hypothetical protein
VTQPHRPETARDSRAVSSWLDRFYRDTGAYVAAWSRLAAVAWSVLGGAAFALAPFFGWRFAAAGLLATLYTLLYVWLGFFYLANPEWKEGGSDGGDT